MPFPLRDSVLVALFAFATASGADEPRIKFNRDVRPILSDTCFTCHGPDSGKVEAGLRLDSFDKATAKLDSGETAIVPGKPDVSELIKRITSTDADLHMPPAKSGKVLTPAQIETLKQWVAEGAKYEGHWAFIAPVRPEVPAVAAASANANPIDKFIRARLAHAGMSPSPRADKETLIRRVTLDLTGLPPTIAEIDAFLADDSPQAYEKVVDRLLMSPAYGERMALPWLDYARYADSNGFQSDGSRDIWGWRDWVIGAFNRNQPFDQFTIEQLAGDMLPGASSEQIIATGFNRNHRLNGEGGRIVEEWFVETVIDRVETTGLTWLGLTMNCCRCHDHKYDPITQKEFYQLFAYFNSVNESGVLAPEGKNGENTPPLFTIKTAADDAKLAELAAITKEKERLLAAATQAQSGLQAEWEAKLHDSLAAEKPTWQVIAKADVKSLGGATFRSLDDGSWLPGGKNPAHDVYEFSAPVAKGTTLSGLLIETIPDASMANQSLGRASNGNYVLTHVEAEVMPATGAAESVEFASIAADYEQPNWPAAAILSNAKKSGKEPGGWAVNGNDPDKRLTRKLLLTLKKPLTAVDDATLKILFRHESIHAQHNIGRFRVSKSSAPVETLSLAGNALPPAIREALQVESGKRSAAQKKALEKFYLEQSPGSLKDAQAALAQAKQAEAKYREDLPTTMVMSEAKPKQAFVLKRGEYDQPGEKVERALPAFLPSLPAGATNDRLGLAKWIVDETNPLTARVWVNRQWEKFFGTGLVKTTENFGSQAEFPSHPDLLDWLACEFMRPTVSPPVNGVPAQRWDMKALQKLIVMSETYQQSSHVKADAMARDPDNRLLSRGPRFRLTGELIRDQALAVSGLLVNKIGGPSVRPYMPPNVWDETSKYGNLRGYKNDHGEGLYRRTMYTIWKRTAAPPTMLLFDAPNREICTIKRSKTNTPLQALSLLNEVTFVEASRKLGERMLTEGGDSAEKRIELGFRLALGRRPTATELKVLSDGLAEDFKRFAADEAAAKKLANIGESKANAAFAPAEIAAYTLTANVLLNLDEFVTKE